MIKIKVSSHGDWPISRQLSSNFDLSNKYKFFINEEIEDCDYWFVFNFLNKNVEYTFCSRDNIILIAPEPEHVQKYYRSYLKQFSKVITNQKHLVHSNKIYSQTGAPWFVNKTYDELSSIKTVKKTKKISIVSSNKIFTKQHKKRYDFAIALKKYFKDKIDLFGRGINSFDDKWDVLAPYEFSIVIENGQYFDYFTEKLTDAYLALSYPIYNGCLNVNEYFNSDSYTLLDIDNMNKAIFTIENIISDSTFYGKHLNSIIESRDKSLVNYNLFNLIISIIETNNSTLCKDKEYVSLKNNILDISTISEKIINKTNYILNKL